MTRTATLTPAAVHEVLGKVDAAILQLLSRRSRQPNVDLFAELNLSGIEAFHTRMLAFLLNPQAPHGQKGLFLDLWLKCLELTGTSSGALVAIEYSITRESRVDLLLKLRDHIILIENKVYAGEGDEQLTRYERWLQGEMAAHKTLIFLTPDGRKPTSGGAPLCLSYGILADWLADCILELDGRLDPGQELAAALSLYRRSCLALFTPENTRMIVDPLLVEQLNTRPLLQTALVLQEQMEALRLKIFNDFWGRVQALVEIGLEPGWKCHLDNDNEAWPLLAIYYGPSLPRKNYYCVAAGNLFGRKAPHAYFGVTRRASFPLPQEAALRTLLPLEFKKSDEWVGEKSISDLPGQRAYQLTDIDDVLALHEDNTGGSARLADGIAEALLVLWRLVHAELQQLNT